MKGPEGVLEPWPLMVSFCSSCFHHDVLPRHRTKGQKLRNTVMGIFLSCRLAYLIFVTGMESEHTSQRYKFAEGRDSALFTTVPLLLCIIKLTGYLYSKSPNPDSGLSRKKGRHLWCFKLVSARWKLGMSGCFGFEIRTNRLHCLPQTGHSC